MHHIDKKKTQQEIDKLLHQYTKYQQAESKEEKSKIGDAMTYSDPIVWMMYKFKAYQESDHEIKTLDDLKHHSLEHGGICEKRFIFLTKEIQNRYGKNIKDIDEFSPLLTLDTFCRTAILNDLIKIKDFIKTWQKYEYHTESHRVAKWENYIPSN